MGRQAMGPGRSSRSRRIGDRITELRHGNVVRRRRFLASPLLLFATGSVASEEDYPSVVPGYRLQFPRDLGSHPAFRSEWWYVTGWVRGADGNDLGIQVTFFRNRPRIAEASRSRFAPRQLLFAHAAIADPRYGRLRHDQRAARAGFGLAEAAEHEHRRAHRRLVARPHRRQLPGADRGAKISGSICASRPRSRSCCKATRDFRARGATSANASYYYSQPQLVVAGQRRRRRPHRRTSAGTAWLDHEWSSAGDGRRGERLGLDRHQSARWRRRSWRFACAIVRATRCGRGGTLRAADGCADTLRAGGGRLHSASDGGVRRAPASNIRWRCACAPAASTMCSTR